MTKTEDEPPEVTKLRALAAEHHTKDRLGVAFKPVPGRVIVGFAEPVAWFTVSPQQARELSQALLASAEFAEKMLQ